MKLEQIELGNKKYDFFVSAAVAKNQTQYLLKLQKGDSEEIKVEDMIEASLDLLYQGLVSARMHKSFFYRLFHRIPKRSQLEHLVDFTELQSRMLGKESLKEGEAPK